MKDKKWCDMSDKDKIQFLMKKVVELAYEQASREMSGTYWLNDFMKPFICKPRPSVKRKER